MVDKGIAISFGKYVLTRIGANVNTELDWNELYKAHEEDLMGQFRKKNKSLIPSIDDVNFIVSKYFDANPEDIRRLKTRRREILGPRQIAQYISEHVLRYNLQAVADYYLNGMHHATIINSRKSVNNMCDTDTVYKSHVNKLIEIITIKQDYGKEIKGDSTKRES